MEISETVSLWVGAIGTLVGVISGGIAIYQWAVINESTMRWPLAKHGGVVSRQIL